MDLALHRRALEVLEAALDRPADTRVDWVASTCGGDKALATAVLGLLRADDAGASVLPTQPAAPGAAFPVDRRPPERIGPWRLTRLLGEGGMSRVYLGERDDGLFEQEVAVKLMSPGLFGAAMGAMFTIERRALARLKHPGIAQIFDGGVEPSGLPYLVMERLTGQAIDDFVRTRALSVRQTVALFLQVAAAVRAAHEGLVVHADIKPSNVIVSDGGLAKLVDFGIAQLMEETAEAATGAFPVTPAYASPQRLAGESPVPADDVFSMGALLSDLLTGAPATGEPRPAPSATLGAAGDLARAKTARGDLDAIVAKSMALQPGGRYVTAAAMAEDLERWLERRPVLARSPGWRMTAGRFVQRHPLGTAASVLAIVGLAAALAVTTALYLQARAARQAAEQRFAEVRGMARYLLFDLYDGLDSTPQSLTLRRDVAREGQLYLDRLSADADAPVGVKVEALEGLARLAAVQGGSARSNLGDMTGARSNLARASRLASKLAAAAPGRADVWRAVARVEIANAGFSVFVDGAAPAADGALTKAQRAIDRARALGADTGQLSADWLIQASAVRQWESRYAEGVALARQALAALPPPRPGDTAAQLNAARAWDLLAEGIYYAGDEAGSVEPYRREVALMQAAARAQPNNPLVLRSLARSRWGLGSTLLSINRSAEALVVLDAGIADAQRLIALDAADQDARRTLGVVTMAKAQALAGVRRFDEAVGLLNEQVRLRGQVWAAAPDQAEAARDYAVAVASLGDVLADAGRKDAACAAYAQGRSAFDALAARSRLTGLDQEHGLRLLESRAKQVCS